MGDLLYSSEAGLWIQVDGPNSKPEYLGAHDVGDISEPLGDVTPLFAPVSLSPSGYQRKGGFQGQPGAPTVTITTAYQQTLDWLERLRPGRLPSLYINSICRGPRNLFLNYERVMVLEDCALTRRSTTRMAAREPSGAGRSDQGFDISPSNIYRIRRLECVRQTVDHDRDLLGIAFRDEQWTTDPIRAPMSVGQFGVCVGEAYSAKAPVFLTINGGQTWTQTAADPFDTGEDAGDIALVQVNASTTRVIVSRGTADAGNPAEIAYSDDSGATWSTVNVGSTNNDIIRYMYCLDYYHIWCVVTGGYIFKSDDGGATWTQQHDGSLVTTELNQIAFMDYMVGYAVGNSNDVLKTYDGGDNWQSIATGSTNINALAVIDYNILWIGFANGAIFYSHDGGDNWTQRSNLPVAITVIKDMKFINRMVGYIAYQDASGYGVLRTWNGGYTWEMLDIPEPTVAVNALAITDVNECYIAGGVDGSSVSVLRKVLPA